MVDKGLTDQLCSNPRHAREAGAMAPEDGVIGHKVRKSGGQEEETG